MTTEDIEKINGYFHDRRQSMKLGGVVSLKSLWAISRPADLCKIIGTKAIVEEKVENDHYRYYINLPLANNEYEELRVIDWSYLEAGDEIDISSIIVIFIDNQKGETILRYDAIFDVGEPLKESDVKSLMIQRNADLLMPSKDLTPMDIKITYEGGSIQKTKSKFLAGKEYIMFYEGNFSSGTLKIHKLSGYINAMPLTHGLILVEGRYEGNLKYRKNFFDVLNADGSILCHKVLSIDYGSNYLIASISICDIDDDLSKDDKLWWFNSETNLWKEIDYPVYKTSNNLWTVELKKNISLKKLQINESLHYYVYHYSSKLEELISSNEGTQKWEPCGDVSFKGVLDKNGKWKINPQQLIDNIDHCLSIIVIRKEDNIMLYDCDYPYNYDSFREIMSADDYEISNKTFLLLKSEKMQGVFDAKAKSLIIPFCIDEKYHILPQTLGDGLIGAYTEEEKKSGSFTRKWKNYYFLDYSGKVRITIKRGYIIESKFHEGQAVISNTNNHGDYHQVIINANGELISDKYLFLGDDYYEDDMRYFDRDNWDAMTDGMYGDYPDDGYDDDYGFMG